MRNVREIEAKWMKDPEFRKAAKEAEFEFAVIELLYKLRKTKRLTQKELAGLADTTQSSIARFESGNSNPTLAFIQKLTNALGAKIKIEV